MAQTGKLAGKVVDASTKEALPFANVVVKLNGTQKGYGQTDIDGNYSISPLTPGSYSVEVMTIGYTTKVITGVVVSTDKTTNLNFDMKSATELGVVDVVTYEVPIISKDETSTGGTLTKEQIQKLPTREVTTMAASTAGVFSSDDNRGVNVKGTRSSATTYYVNGVKQIGPVPNLPVSAISQMSVLNGGIPAQYGDAVGGIINITTAGPSSRFMGSLTGETSTIFDKYDQNLLEFSLTGPLLKVKSNDTTLGLSNERTVLGFFVAAQYQGAKDNNPSPLGVYKVKDDVLNRIQTNPFIFDANTGFATPRAETLTLDSLEKIKARQNADYDNLSLNASIDFQPKDNMTFTVGGTYEHFDQNVYVEQYSLLNPNYNPQRLTTNYSTYARFTQNFRNIGSESSGIKNAYYQIQFDYAKVKQTTQRKDYEDDIARYGYIGKFDQQTRPFYARQDSVKVNGVKYENPMVDLGDVSTQLTFTPSGDNPYAANYTRQLIEIRENAGLSPFTTVNQLLGARGLVNGTSPNLIYSLYSATGTPYMSYSVVNNDQYRLSALGSAEFGKHTIKLGFEFEQRLNTNFSVSGSGLWGAARGLANTHIIGLDPSTATVRQVNDTTYIDYDNLIDPSIESTFSKNIRKNLNIAQNQRLNVDALSPDDLSLSLFSADELTKLGVVNYQGYTFDGKRNTKSVAFNDYFTNVKERPQDAIRPVYAAAFIEDKFEIEDLVLRVGVRVDRYDA
ncbi:MAG: carboxypeptidase-like regulatory domain-containing protein, partial [Hymenobacteraceae bacterium]|nr:carboxypeptidase-like regulatory domain-containing protein [Hymenobacteraceae bacterium]MDX5511355.1 carboxypeptidase-like regulatory domain-containing protein [Hymenobacteraceae bacterium]